ncbi:putative aldouronate transport system substrate-binding protein [Paenibacillus phyllosphaerae]|uniref:Putative aldouronate transport system substrate-binding protein n=1 Tax=Paenibacillus phyllosphaerae TaxID=274593 RepID=A0A7W5AYY1_9BACL|nr:ABC transporter substrate-binding protein [Paenibacillus phyllosphaerae]MBB3111348.1 putative aldouronate transport system substrate-binding protein [Paenibacillus phyllosphaerae]
MGMKWTTPAKSATILLAAAIGLAACGNAEGEPKSNGGGNQSAPNKTYEVVMTYPAFGDVTDVQAVQDAISAITAEKVGATVKLVPVNGSNYANQLNLMLSGSEKLDLAYTSVWFGFESQVSRGQLLPMDEPLAASGKGILETVPEATAEAGKIKGETYGIPSMKAWALSPSLVMRKDLLDKHGIDTTGLKTWSDADSVLQVIKDKEPGVAPMVSYTAQETPGTAMLYFDPLGTAPGVLEFEGTDYAVEEITATDAFANMAALMKQWFDKGYFNKDIATTQETGSSLIKAGKAFSFIRNINDCYTESVAAGAELVCVPLESSYMTRNSVASNMMSLARNSENPEKAIQVLDLLYTDEAVINLFTNGIEGKHYVKSTDGLIAKPEGVERTGYDSNQYAVGNNFLSYVWTGNAPDIWKQLQALNESAVKSRAMGFSFDINPVKAQIASVTNVQNQYDAGFQTGISDPAELAVYREKLKQAGIEKIVAEKQKQLDEWLDTK